MDEKWWRHSGANAKWQFYLPSMPTMKLISDISSLLNMAPLRSRTVGLVACQFGSPVSIVNMLFGMVNDVELCAPGDVSGDDGILDGWVTCISSRCVWRLCCGAVDEKWLPYGDSTTILEKLLIRYKHSYISDRSKNPGKMRKKSKSNPMKWIWLNVETKANSVFYSTEKVNLWPLKETLTICPRIRLRERHTDLIRCFARRWRLLNCFVIIWVRHFIRQIINLRRLVVGYRFFFCSISIDYE